ncbi:hypothetical protein E2C01_050679 [Portunus trituberculatus]|uniref:Uncharacterized protein n=1 Tax=Portunus trituberculatus TaxID=210409 RepID=A0A5B7GJL6_PORTR|nr:hypothetical protein [Portunus trituberculatus]
MYKAKNSVIIITSTTTTTTTFTFLSPGFIFTDCWPFHTELLDGARWSLSKVESLSFEGAHCHSLGANTGYGALSQFGGSCTQLPPNHRTLNIPRRLSIKVGKEVRPMLQPSPPPPPTGASLKYTSENVRYMNQRLAERVVQRRQDRVVRR